jgi:hypothetical protein
MNQGLSQYVNAAGRNWGTLVPFYLTAYRATPLGTSGYSPYYLLHGKDGFSNLAEPQNKIDS